MHFNAGIGTFLWGHWRISTQALVHFNAGISAFQLGALGHFEGIGAFQRRHLCISTQASAHFNAGIGAFQRMHWCISKKMVHFNGGSASGQW